jgi:pimeloyl-ACP methyl ester carboxylesterase
MSPPGRPKGEFRSAQHEGTPVTVALHSQEWPYAGPTVVCLHGTSYSAQMWAPLAQRLASGFRVVAFDLRGHGESAAAPPGGGYTAQDHADDLLRAVDAGGLGELILIGYSLGSRVALEFAARHPSRVRKAVFLDLSFEMPKATSDAMIQDLLNRAPSFDDEDQALAVLRALPDHRRFSEALHRQLLRTEFRRTPEGRLSWCYDRDAVVQTLRVAAQDMWPQVRRVACPVLVLRGDSSPALTAQTAARLEKEFADVRVERVPDAGHAIWGDNPAFTGAAIERFLASSV